MPVQLSIEQEALRALAKACKEHEDGKKFRSQLGKDLRAVLKPVVNEVKAGLMATGHHGPPTRGEPLRSNVAKGIRAQARFAGKATGARLSAKKTPQVREFTNAPKRLNSKKGWRHPLFGNRDKWVRQRVRRPGWWDQPIDANADKAKQAVIQIMAETAEKLASEGG